jgi:hypothetical protein
MSRISALEARRQALLNKCEEQRLELSYRVAQITPRNALTAWTRSRRADGKGGGIGSLLPLIAGAGGLLMMLMRRRRRRRYRGGGGGAGLGVGLIATVLALAGRATTVLRLLAQVRSLYMTYKATRRPERP